MILFKGGASEPYDMRLPDKAGGAVAVRRTLASTICRIADPTQVPRPRQLRDASTVMRFRPAHQSVINRRHDDRVSCLARHSLKQTLERKPRTRLPATWNGGHESEITGKIGAARSPWRSFAEIPSEIALAVSPNLRVRSIAPARSYVATLSQGIAGNVWKPAEILSLACNRT